MGDMGGLPALSDKRLIVLQKQSRRVRKGITIRNDKLKNQKTKVEKMVDKHKASGEYLSWQKSLPIKNSLAEIRGLQKCLKKRRESSTLDPELTPRNGIYDGVSLDAMKEEVDNIIQDKNPRQRRLRKVERIKNDGFRDGRIVDYENSMAKFSEMLQRPKGIFRGERAVSALDLLRETPTSSQPTTPTFSPDLEDGPAQFRLPPIQARRSTIANTSLVTRPRHMFDAKSDRSDPCHSIKQRSMSFALAR